MRSVPFLPLICASGLLFTGVAQADQTVSYNYAELSYVRSNVEVGGGLGDIDGDGGRFGISFELSDSLYLVGNYEVIDLDDVSITLPGGAASVSLDVDTWSAGVGWHSGVSSNSSGGFNSAKDRWSLFAQAEYVSFDVDGASTVDGFEAKVGARGINHTNFEFIGAIGYQELENADGELVVEGRLTYDITDDFEAQLGVDYVEDFIRGFVGVRFNFPTTRN